MAAIPDAMEKTSDSLWKWVLIVGAGILLARWQMPPVVRQLFEFSTGMRIATALWLVFAVYWSLAAKDKAASKDSESVWSRRLHLLLVNAGALLLLLRVPGLTQRFLPLAVEWVAGGLLIEIGSLLLAISARRHLGSNWSGEVRIAAGHQLIRTGPYRILRHPIYTAVLGMYLGTAIVFGEMHSLIGIVLVGLAYWRKIGMEERALSQAFGAEYEDYRRQTSALLPGL
jgi:protein-S-isoprenylcysteine O-methyltransferase Ste14